MSIGAGLSVARPPGRVGVGTGKLELQGEHGLPHVVSEMKDDVRFDGAPQFPSTPLGQEVLFLPLADDFEEPGTGVEAVALLEAE
jgi:hypothetical protein